MASAVKHATKRTVSPDTSKKPPQLDLSWRMDATLPSMQSTTKLT